MARLYDFLSQYVRDFKALSDADIERLCNDVCIAVVKSGDQIDRRKTLAAIIKATIADLDAELFNDVFGSHNG